jgi:hypothetical protein
MTDFVLSSGSICRPFRSPWGSFPTRGFAVSSGVSSAAIQLGRPVTLDFTEAGQTSNASYVKASTADNTFYLAGIAGEAASGVGAVNGVTMISVWECNPLVEFKAVTKAGTIQSSHAGLTKTLHFDSTLNIAYVDLSASTASDHRVVITQAVGVDGASQGDSGAYVAFRFIGDSRRQGSTIVSSTPYLAFYR